MASLPSYSAPSRSSPPPAQVAHFVCVRSSTQKKVYVTACGDNHPGSVHTKPNDSTLRPRSAQFLAPTAPKRDPNPPPHQTRADTGDGDRSLQIKRALESPSCACLCPRSPPAQRPNRRTCLSAVRLPAARAPFPERSCCILVVSVADPHLNSERTGCQVQC